MNENYTVKGIKRNGTVRIVAENIPNRTRALTEAKKLNDYLGCIYTRVEIINTDTDEIEITLKPKAKRNDGITIRNNIIKGWY